MKWELKNIDTKEVEVVEAAKMYVEDETYEFCKSESYMGECGWYQTRYVPFLWYPICKFVVKKIEK